MRPNGLSQGIAVSVVGVVGIDWFRPVGESQDGSTCSLPAGTLRRCGAQRKSTEIQTRQERRGPARVRSKFIDLGASSIPDLGRRPHDRQAVA